MDFKLGFIGRIVLFFILLFGGCYNQADVDRGTPVMANIRAHDCNPYYVYAEYPEIWPLVEDSAGLYTRIRYGGSGVITLGSPNGMLMTEASYPAWVYEETLRNRMWPEWIGRYILEKHLDYLLPHVPLEYDSQADLEAKLRALKAKKFADVRASIDLEE